MRWSKPPSKPAFDTCDMVKFKWWMFNHYIKSWDFIWDMNGVFLGVYNQSEFGWYTHFFGCSSILIGMCIPIILENPFMMVGWPHHILGRHTECVLHWWRTKGRGWSFPYVYRHKACKNSRQNPTASSSPHSAELNDLQLRVWDLVGLCWTHHRPITSSISSL